MLDTNDLLVAIKKAAIDAVENIKPVNIAFGKIESIDPLSVNVENKLKLSSEQLIMRDIFKEYELECEVDGKIGIARLDLKLKPGDDVILFRVQGGQKYLVLDRVVK